MKKIVVLLLLSLAASACSDTQPAAVEEKYDQAMLHIEKGEYSLAPPLLQAIIRESPGTRYATFSYLKLADSLLEEASTKEEFDTAEVNYRIFLVKSHNNHLVPYVIGRLIELNYRRNTSRFFGDEYAFARDPGHFNTIIRDYQRFYLLYPNSFYLDDAVVFRDKAIEALAEHELIIGDWYFKHQHYTSAIARYSYILEQYPNSQRREQVILNLIKALERNQQPAKAEELRAIAGQEGINLGS